MKLAHTRRTESRSGRRTDPRVAGAGHHDQQLAELIEFVWSCERQWRLEDRIEAAIRLDSRS